MTTVTGLTADRMLAIEAASVVSGTVDANGNLILTTKGGTQINAGPVKGPPGPQGPVGSFLSVLSAASILDVGVSNQIRAGRQLSPADFANIGLNPPLGLWNLSDLTDASGYGRNLQNKGAVPFAAGINGGVNTAAQFIGSAAQALYISDTGVNDPFKIKTGSLGCWMRTARQATYSPIISKYGVSNYSWYIGIEGGNKATMQVSTDGSSSWLGGQVSSFTTISDDRWHFIVGVIDGTQYRMYVDGILEGVLNSSGVPFNSNSPLNIGSASADSSTAAVSPFVGRVDEAFVTADILSDDQVRNLYCAKILHTLAAVPSRLSVNVRRRRKGAALVASDFSAQPIRLHNFSAGSLGNEGSSGSAGNLTNNGNAVSVPGADGTTGNAFSFNGSNVLLSNDTDLPTALATRSYGCWFKSLQSAGAGIILDWGTALSADARVYLTNGTIAMGSGGDAVPGPFAADGLWHFAVVVEDNGALDGIKRKLYYDGRLVVTSLVMNAIGGAGAQPRCRIGTAADGTYAFVGQTDGVFICGYAMAFSEIAALYAKGSQALTPSPKNVGDHIEAMDANSLLAIFDTLDSQHQVDLGVAA